MLDEADYLDPFQSSYQLVDGTETAVVKIMAQPGAFLFINSTAFHCFHYKSGKGFI